MKISILYKFKDTPYGGANQFLKALRQELVSENHFEPNPLKADVVLANANPGNLKRLSIRLAFIKQLNKRAVVVVRLDGPISLVRGTARSHLIDSMIAKLINKYAHSVIFQSEWSRRKNQQLLNLNAVRDTVIHNAADSNIFHPGQSQPHPKPVKLIASSWSSNPRKGFDVYEYLDKHLDFSRYAMTFVGNSPIRFANIRTLPPQSSAALANILRQHNIFLTASRNDPCSNSLIEALSCGLPAVVRNSGGHPELIGQGGLAFENNRDVLSTIDQLAGNLASFQAKLPRFALQDTTGAYLQFANSLVHEPVR